MAAQDDSEPFDLVDEAGHPLGRSKPRHLVHRDGDWHRSLHLWVVERRNDRVWLWFQRRSPEKDTWPSALDIAVTGHLRAGETVTDALREAEEEIGLVVEAARVVTLGVRKRRERMGSVVDNEIQSILATESLEPFEAMRPSVDEVTALVGLPFEDAQALLLGDLASAEGRSLDARTRAVSTCRVEKAHFIPAPDGYVAIALESLAAWLSGRPLAPFALG